MSYQRCMCTLFSCLLLGVSSPSAAESGGQAAGSAPRPAFEPGEYLAVDGSTSAHPLQMTIACHLLGADCSWREAWPLSDTRSVLPELELNADITRLEPLLNLQHSGTHGAYLNLIARQVDLVLVARRPSSDELEAAGRVGIDLEAHPIARDAFVFLGHRDNPVKSLSLEQIRDIYTGAVGDWETVGGPSLPINAYQRQPNSGSQELMEALVMRGAPMIDAKDMLLMGMMGPINAISSDPAGIGYSVYFYAKYILPREEVALLAVEGVQPDQETISNGTYSLSTQVFAVLRAEHSDDSTRGWLRWVLSPEGQSVVAKSGYIPLAR